jgi:hypothetical protein
MAIAVREVRHGNVLPDGDLLLRVPFAQQHESRLVFSARTSGDPRALVGLLRKTIGRVDPEWAVLEAGTGRGMVDTYKAFFGTMGGIAGVLGAIALLLALAGLFGVLSHVVERRPPGNRGARGPWRQCLSDHQHGHS